MERMLQEAVLHRQQVSSPSRAVPTGPAKVAWRGKHEGGLQGESVCFCSTCCAGSLVHSLCAARSPRHDSQVTTALSCWPEGIWRGTTFGDRGQLLCVRHYLTCVRLSKADVWSDTSCLPQVVAHQRHGAVLDFVLGAAPRVSVPGHTL